jgi:hypothetical protein
MKLWEIERRLLTCTPSASPSPLSSPLPSPGDEEICGNPIIIEAGETSVIVSLNFVMEAMITKVIVRKSYPDTLNNATHFTVDLFNREITEDNLATLGALSRVIPQQTTLINNTMELFAGTAGGGGWSFYNMDSSPTVQSRIIWMRIGLVTTGATDLATFDTAIGAIATGQGRS